MSSPSTHEVTALLRAWSAGDAHALEELTSVVYRHLHRLAHRYMGGERPGDTLQTTALINEVFLRLVPTPAVSWQDRAHFFALCAQMMRRILTDLARARYTHKRGGGALAVELDSGLMVAGTARPNLVALDDALEHLGRVNLRKSRVVELRFFGGLSVQETAEVLQVSPETVMRDWRLAKAWLWRELRPDQDDAT